MDLDPRLEQRFMGEPRCWKSHAHKGNLTSTCHGANWPPRNGHCVARSLVRCDGLQWRLGEISPHLLQLCRKVTSGFIARRRATACVTGNEWLPGLGK
ncbi:hypothetical protein AAFF_G00208710 [Aldrovandia affinis]|uniref:Uncharacterized protein n=1 Tax=Aldrovandia affinis TaxID=143900 RepID=A0AAD7RH87_9TELE|nr:hypothetical protein AAFF_G00208710 [Aldrovandia affinis]